MFVNLVNMMSNTSDICDGLGPVLGLIGWVVLVIKIAVPIILIVVGMLNMAQAIMEKKEDKIQDAQKALIKEVIVAVIVFLVITIVTLLFSTIMKQRDWKECATCINDPRANQTCEINTLIDK